jgi:hypothetical protein
MPPLAELQSHVRRAVVNGDTTAVAPLLLGGTTGLARLAIHQRHYRASLVRALIDRFPATVWLTGSDFFADAARRFVSAHPPVGPCVAEYGDGFPAFLATLPAVSRLEYLRDFAELELRYGQAALEIDLPPLSIGEIATGDPAMLADTVIGIQPGVRYWHARWPVDDLLKAYLTDRAPDRFVMDPQNVYLEVRGARGHVRISRLCAGDFTFRSGLMRGGSLGVAAEHSLDGDPAFDPGRALAALIAEDLVAAVTTDTGRSR